MDDGDLFRFIKEFGAEFEDPRGKDGECSLLIPFSQVMICLSYLSQKSLNGPTSQLKVTRNKEMTHERLKAATTVRRSWL